MTAETLVRPAETVTAAPSCRICGKAPDAPHDSATRTAHLDHFTRLGWSGMCTAPRSQASEVIRASLVSAGWTATSPDHLTPEDRRLYREEGQS